MALRFAEPAEEAYSFPLTIGHLLDSAIMSSGDRQIVYREQVRFDYRELRQRIGRLASVLTSLGAHEGMTIAMMDWDSHRYLEAYFAVPMMGAVLQTVNVRLAPVQIAYTLAHARAEILLVHRDFFPLVETLLPQLPAIRAVIAIADGVEAPLPRYAVGEYEVLGAAGEPAFAFRDFDENAIASTFYTTGTTGEPKGVCFSHRQIVLLTLAANAPFGVTGGGGFGHGDVYMPLTPMFHVHAWGVPYIATMLGVKQVYPGRYDPDILLELRQREGVTFSHCVPTILRMVLDAATRRGADLSGWKMKIGGAALTGALCAEGRRRGMLLTSGYGMSETAPTIAVARWRASDEDEEARIASMTVSGVPIPLVSARIVDDDLRELPTDGKTQGELVLRAPWLTPCYTGNPDASAALWRGGWMHTQDVATIDPDGTIVVRDRLKDVIKTGGEWLSSLTLENLVASVEGVAEVAVIGLSDPRWGERPLAVIRFTGDAPPTLADFNAPISAAVARGELSRYALLDRFELVETMPRTSVGKIDKKLLRERLASQASATGWPGNSA
jgi:fatty-acyl-CoA synthase